MLLHTTASIRRYSIRKSFLCTLVKAQHTYSETVSENTVRNRAAMPQITGKEIGSASQAIGFGLMGLTWRPNPVTYSEAFTAMKAALSSGANFWNGGEFYGPPNANSLQLLAEYFTKYPEDADKVVISIKGALHPTKLQIDGSAEGVRRSVDNCLKLLNGKKFLDVFECGRVDPKVPIEETIETLAEYVKAGKLGGISLSECGPDTIRRAAKVHKIEAVEVEFSLFATEILENGVAKACAELDIPIVAYSPLGRGFLTGQIKSIDDIPEGEFRRSLPRFQGENFQKNLELVKEVEKVAESKGCTPGQVAIAWVKVHSAKDGLPVIIPIPGATTEDRVLENNKQVDLTDAEINELNDILKRCVVHGGRYADDKLNFGESPAR